jgi:hypothetical protein
MMFRSLAAAMVVCTGLATTLAQTTTPNQPKSPSSQPGQPKTQPSDRPGGTPSDRMSQPGDRQKMRDDMKKMAEPTQEHKDLVRAMAGEWSTNVTFRHGANEPPSTTTGKARIEPVLGNRFLREHFDSEMSGEPMKGEGLFGYNTISKKYESVWVDSFSPGIMYMTGTKKGDKEIEFTGEIPNPHTGQQETVRSVMRFDSNDKMTYEMYAKGSEGSEFKALEVVYPRTGGASPPGSERPNVRPGVEPKGTPTTPDRPTTPGSPNSPDTPRTPTSPSPRGG